MTGYTIIHHRREILHKCFSALTALAAVGAVGCLSVRPPGGGERHVITTADGWQLSLRRALPSKPLADAAPVILCHGIALNGRFWNLRESASFHDWLVEQGFEVWTVNLRGAGDSQKPVLPAVRSLASGNPRRLADTFAAAGAPRVWGADILIDDHIRGDLPAVIGYVKAVSGRPSVAWVGHSLGGMIALAALTERPAWANDLATVVAIGSPMRLVDPPTPEMQLLRNLAPGALALNHWLGAGSFGQLSLLSGGLMGHPIAAAYFAPANASWADRLAVDCLVLEDIPGGVLLGVIDMIASGRFASASGQDYADGLPAVDTPTLMLAGTADRVASPAAIRFVHDRLASPVKAFHEFGRSTGCSQDYGHADLVVGPPAPSEVWPVIADWLNRHARGQTP